MGTLRRGLVVWILTLAAPLTPAANPPARPQDSPPVAELFGRSLDLLEQSASATAFHQLLQESAQALSHSGPHDAELVLALVDTLQAGFRKHANASNRSLVEADAVGCAQAVARALQSEQPALAARILETSAPQAAGLPSEGMLHTELATLWRRQGDLAAAERWLSSAREVLFPDGVDPFADSSAAPAGEGAPTDERSRVTEAYWFESSSAYFFVLGAFDAAALYAEELARRAAELDQPNLKYMAVDAGMRTALGRGRLAHVRSLWHSIAEEPWLAAWDREWSARLEVHRAWAEVEAEWLGQPTETDPEALLLDLVTDEGARAENQRTASVALAMLYVGRGRDRAALAALAPLEEAGLGEDSDGDRLLMPHTLALRVSRLEEDADALRSAMQPALEAFEGLLERWHAAQATGRRGGFLQLVLRSAFLTELMRAEIELHPGDEGPTRALRLLARTQDPKERPSDVEATLELLRRTGRCTLVYVPSRLGTLLLCLTKDSITLTSVPDHDRLNEQRATLDAAALDLLAEPSEARERVLDEALREAGDAFLPSSVRQHVAEAHELVVIGAADFGWPCFELFELEDGHPLGLELSISYLSGLPQARRLAHAWQTQEPEAGALLLVAPRTADEHQQVPLPFGAAEQELAQRAGAAFDSARTRLLCGPEARSSAMSAASDRAYLGVVAHGLHDPRRAQPTGLLLAPETTAGPRNGAVWFADVAAMQAPPVVALFACRAGLSPVRRGSGSSGSLAGAFEHAGARAVALATTELDYRGSLELQAHFTQELRAGHAVAEALRRARVRRAAGGRAAETESLLVRIYGWGAAPLFDAPSRPLATFPWSQVAWALIALAFVLGVRAALATRRWNSSPAQQD